jgi:hypothetical protein
MPTRKFKIKMGTTGYERCHTKGTTWEKNEKIWERKRWRSRKK